MEGPKNDKVPLTFYVVIVLTALGPLLGGSVKLWAQAVIGLGTGLLLMLSPPRKSLGLWPNIAFSLVLALALAAFLPAHWFPAAEWRTDLAKLGVQLPGTVSPQPWLTLESALLFGLELSWAYYLLANDWNLPSRWKAWSLTAAAISILAGLLIISFVSQKRIPFWPLNVPEFGFFPNRNHTSNVLGLGGILVYALALRGFDEGRKNWWVWLIALSLIGWALIVNYSRAGIILLCGGAVAWHLYWLFASQHRRRPLVASGAIVLLLAFFIWDGGKTAMRFGRETAAFFYPSQNVRFAIYHDAIDLSLKSPLTGVGLGNFSAVFTTHRHDAIAPYIAGHPESDWIWTAVELGWLAPLLIALLFCWWAKRCFPFEPGTFRLMRMAAFVCVCGFALHALFDVPGHQIGALWPVLFLASTAIHPKQRFRESRKVSAIFRAVGALLVIIALLWFGSLSGLLHFPNRQAVEQLSSSRRADRDRGDYAEAVAAASAALRIAPLDWSAYEGRGVAELALHSDSDAMRDFAVARYLLPYWSDLWLKQGVLWAAADEVDRAFDLWTDMLRRFPKEAPILYGQIFQLIKLDSDLVDRWRQLGRENKQCLLIFFQSAGPVEFEVELDRLLSEDPELRTFDRNEKGVLFSAWYRTGDKLVLAQTLQERPEWKEIAWRELAHVYADYQDYRQACETVLQFAPTPELPQPKSQEPLETLKARFLLNRTDIGGGLTLYFAQMKEGQIDDALRTMRELTALPDSPKYLFYLEAQLWVQKKEWKNAWQALARFEFGHP